jgi:hypothetical protein
MTLLPPNFAEPYSSFSEREQARQRLVKRDKLLRSIEAVAHKPLSQWSPSELASFPPMTNGMREDPIEKLNRWRTLFAEELREVHRLASMTAVSDIELKQGLFMAGRLLITVTGRAADELDNITI